MFKKKIKYLIFFLILLNPCLIHANDKIFYIDIDLILNNSLAGKSITSQLKKINKLNIDIFKKEKENLKSEETTILAQKNILDENEYKKKITLFRKKISGLNEEKKNSMNDFNKKRIKAQSLLINSLTPIIADYAEKNKTAIIIDKKNVIVGKTDLDITQIILKTLDNKIKNIKIK